MYINISRTYSCISLYLRLTWCWAKLGGAIRISSWDTVFFEQLTLEWFFGGAGSNSSGWVKKSWGDLDFRMGIYTERRFKQIWQSLKWKFQQKGLQRVLSLLIPSDSKHCQGEVTPRQQTACQSVGERVQVKGERCWCGRWEWSFGYLGGFLNQVEMEE